MSATQRPEFSAPIVSICPDLSKPILPALPEADTQMVCRRCGALDLPAVAPGSGPHAYKAVCRHCGAWIKWLSTRTQAERHARNEHFYQQWLKKAQEAR